ncbi:hypothetical protein D3C72_1767500 [compost metagenome]
MVRLAMVMLFGFCAAKCVAHNSIISPAPMNSTFCSAILSKMRCDRRTAAAAMDTLWAPISVLLRTSLATEKLRWNNWCRYVPRPPASSAVRIASLICPRIWVSPSTIESSPEATRKVWRTASCCGSIYKWGRSSL